MIEDENVRLGSFRASFVEEDNIRYFQVEDFDTPEWADKFLDKYNREAWYVLPGGIYRVPLHILRQ